jgi:hypothetical protein
MTGAAQTGFVATIRNCLPKNLQTKGIARYNPTKAGGICTRFTIV